MNDVEEIMRNANMKNYGADTSHRRTGSENQLKDSIEILSDYFNHDNPFIKAVAVLACFIGNAYILRQSGDYDSLFEVKVDQRDIIYWTIASSNLIDLIMSVSEFKIKEEKSRIQRLDANSSQQTLNDSLNGRTNSIMIQTGIIVDSSFDFIKYGLYLYQNKGFYPINSIGRYELMKNDRPYISLQKRLIGTDLVAVLTVSKEGLIRIDVFL